MRDYCQNALELLKDKGTANPVSYKQILFSRRRKATEFLGSLKMGGGKGISQILPSTRSRLPSREKGTYCMRKQLLTI
ncbi:hypothetical protein ABH14_29395 [Brevibacillus brevis]|nr:hypothetical protein [Brevibacillus brevis]